MKIIKKEYMNIIQIHLPADSAIESFYNNHADDINLDKIEIEGKGIVLEEIKNSIHDLELLMHASKVKIEIDNSDNIYFKDKIFGKVLAIVKQNDKATLPAYGNFTMSFAIQVSNVELAVELIENTLCSSYLDNIQNYKEYEKYINSELINNGVITSVFINNPSINIKYINNRSLKAIIFPEETFDVNLLNYKIIIKKNNTPNRVNKPRPIVLTVENNMLSYSNEVIGKAKILEDKSIELTISNNYEKSKFMQMLDKYGKVRILETNKYSYKIVPLLLEPKAITVQVLDKEDKNDKEANL